MATGHAAEETAPIPIGEAKMDLTTVAEVKTTLSVEISESMQVPLEAGNSDENLLIKEEQTSCVVCNNSSQTGVPCAEHQLTHSKDPDTALNIVPSQSTSNSQIFSGGAPFKCGICGETFSLRSRLRSHRSVHLAMDTVSCRVCGKAFHTKADLEKHIRIHMEDNPFSCDSCGEAFKTRRRLLKHQTASHSKSQESNNASDSSKTHKRGYVCTYCCKTFKCRTHHLEHERIHTNEKPFDCKKCGKAFAAKSGLARHMATHTCNAGNRKTFPCSKCGISFPTYYAIAKHRQAHKDRPHVCSVCKKMFARAKKLQKHLQEHKKEEHVCGTCNKRFLTHMGLKKHRESHKAVQKLYKCLSCSRSFKKASSLQRHQRSSHKATRKNTCKFCQKSFKKLSGLNLHLRTHAKAKNIGRSARPSSASGSKSDKDKYLCGICSNSFETYYRMRQHKQMHQERPFMCDTCEETFVTETDLSQHKQSVCIDPFVCNECQKTFPSLKTLQRHRIKHVMERPYLCGVCLKSFKSTNQLKAHMLNHLNGKPHSCPFCGEDFAKPKSLRRHQQICQKNPDSGRALLAKHSDGASVINYPVSNDGLPASHRPELQTLMQETQRAAALTKKKKNSAFGEQPSNSATNFGHLTPVAVNPSDACIGEVSVSLWEQQEPRSSDSQLNVQRGTHGQSACAIPGFLHDVRNSEVHETSGEVDLLRTLNLRVPRVVLSAQPFSTLQETLRHSELRKVYSDADAQSSDGDNDFGLNDTFDDVDDDVIEMSCREVFSPGPFTEKQDDSPGVSQASIQSTSVRSANQILGANTPMLQLVVDKIELFTCNICKKDFQTKLHLDHHKLSHQEENPAEIVQAGESSIVQQTEDTENALTCFFCQKDFLHYTKLLQHECPRIQEKFGETEATTSSVAAACTSKEMYENLPHVSLVHENNEPVVGEIQKATGTGKKRQGKRVGGQQSSHGAQGKASANLESVSVIKCGVSRCKKVFASLALLKQHKLTHTKDRPYGCDKCDNMFHTKAHLKEHHIRAHMNLREFKCQHCDKEFCRRSDMNRHAKTHEEISAAAGASGTATGQVTEGQGECSQQSSLPADDSTSVNLDLQCVSKCGVCKEVFSSIDLLQRHKLTHMKDRPYCCNKCDKMYRTNAHLKEHHMRAHTNLRQFKCQYCDKNFRMKSDFKQHAKTHNGISAAAGASGAATGQVTEGQGECGQQSSLPAESSTTVKIYSQCFSICGVCKEVFPSIDLYKRHKLTHMKDRPYCCDKCDKMYRTKAHLKEHHIRAHTNLREFKCQHCDKEFCRRADLNQHAKTHRGTLAAAGGSGAATGQVTEGHSICGQQISLTAGDSTSVNLDSQCVSKCGVCKEVFSSVALLKQHKLTHMKDRPYCCDKCDKMYRTKAHLKEHHMRAHTNLREFKCQYCDKNFRMKSDLSKHVKTHKTVLAAVEASGASSVRVTRLAAKAKGISSVSETEQESRGEETFACTVCEKTFFDQSSLSDHECVHSGEQMHGFKSSLQSHVKNPSESTQSDDSAVGDTDKGSGVGLPDTSVAADSDGGKDVKLSINNNAGLVSKKTAGDDDKIRKLTCPICQRGFARKPQLSRHLQTHSIRIRSNPGSSKKTRDDVAGTSSSTCRQLYGVSEESSSHLATTSEETGANLDLSDVGPKSTAGATAGVNQSGHMPETFKAADAENRTDVKVPSDLRVTDCDNLSEASSGGSDADHGTEVGSPDTSTSSRATDAKDGTKIRFLANSSRAVCSDAGSDEAAESTSGSDIEPLSSDESESGDGLMTPSADTSKALCSAAGSDKGAESSSRGAIEPHTTDASVAGSGPIVSAADTPGATGSNKAAASPNDSDTELPAAKQANDSDDKVGLASDTSKAADAKSLEVMMQDFPIVADSPNSSEVRLIDASQGTDAGSGAEVRLQIGEQSAHLPNEKTVMMPLQSGKEKSQLKETLDAVDVSAMFSFCNEEFSSLLKQHKILSHEKKLFQCNQCEKTYRTNNRLKEHLRTHKNVTKFKCPVCNQEFTRKFEFKQHKQTHTTDRVMIKPKVSETDPRASVGGDAPGAGSSAQPCGDLEELLSMVAGSDETDNSSKNETEPQTTDAPFDGDGPTVSFTDASRETSAASSSDDDAGSDSDYEPPAADDDDSDDEVGPVPETSKAIDDASGSKVRSPISENSAGLPTEKAVVDNARPRSAGGQNYICRFCGKVFIHESRLLAHERVHAKQKTFQCDHCDKAFTYRSSFVNHNKKVHNVTVPNQRKKGKQNTAEGSLTCCLCNEKFPSKTLLRQHETWSHADEKEFKCDQCYKAYFYKNHLEEHKITSHSDIRKFKCQVCDKGFPRKSNLNQHKRKTGHLDVVERATSSRSDFECVACNHCDEKFSSKTLLQKHKMQSHGEGRPFTCDLCDKTYRVYSHLKEHHIWAHTNLRRFQCRLCNRGFLKNCDLERHKVLHRRRDPKFAGDIAVEDEAFVYVCILCKEEFSSLVKLKDHEGSKHQVDRHYTCSQCKEWFQNLTLLRQHQLDVHTSSEALACKVCGKTCSTMSSLVRHEYAHWHMNAIQCTLCGGKHLPSRQPHRAVFYKRHSSWQSEVQRRAQKGRSKVKEMKDAFRRKRNRRFQCMTCGGSFLKMSSYTRHQEIHAAGDELNFCSSCGKHLKTARHLHRHKLMFHPKDQVANPSGEPRKCEKCQMEVRNRNALIKHLKYMHTKQCLHSCKQCRASFQSIWRLHAHKQQMHPAGPVKLYVCTVCNKGFRMQYFLRKHRAIHPGKEELTCTFCSARFKTVQCLLSHKYKKHRSGEQFMCDLCGKIFASAVSLKKHKVIHSDKRPFICEHCGKTYKTHKALRSHRKTRCHETHEFICPFCGKSYPKNNYLAVHLRSHRDKRRSCPVCQKVFKYQRILTVHINRAHTNVRPFACDLCPKKFHSTAALQSHQHIHTGAKPYKCKICGDAFRQKGTLYRHIKGVHKEGKKNTRRKQGMKTQQAGKEDHKEKTTKRKREMKTLKTGKEDHKEKTTRRKQGMKTPKTGKEDRRKPQKENGE
ncbi:uncharacterized protein LOC119725802 isoform X2 [Patiria miniata]|uniref:C2H2-type domain-containing protein n=1 Tax=Patiria miniata TaxID=46514 RepID=A0A913ZQA6_PATMI|nr:uncharacterized protein LOC119725802 isoform X2 [Patiria miniata]